MKIRLFVAVKISPYALEKLLTIRDEIFAGEKIKWETKDKLHLTLKFIGDFEEGKIPELIAELKNISEKFEKFDLRFSRFGLFKRNGNPSVLYAETEPSKQLAELHIKIDEMLAKFNVASDKRKFKPHLTLLRIKNRQINKLDELLRRKISYIKFTVDKFYLIKSELKPTGSVYSEIESFNLK